MQRRVRRACRCTNDRGHDGVAVLNEDRALDRIADWPVDHASVATFTAAGPTASVGDPDRAFALASVTKLLTALVALVAVEEESIGLDEPAGPPGATVRHLLAHASGLGPEAADGVRAPPGRRRIYSNAGFEALAELIAARTATAFPDYLAEAVLGPLGMASTRLVGSPAHGSESTMADVVRLGVELSAPTLISPATLALATTPAFADLAGVLPGFGQQDPNPWGLGFEIRGHKSPHWTGTANDPATFGHFGRSGTFVWVDPVAGLGCVALTDRPFGPWAQAAWPELSDALLHPHAAGRPADRSR